MAERLRDAGASSLGVGHRSTSPGGGSSSVEVDVRNAEEVATATRRVVGQNSRIWTFSSTTPDTSRALSPLRTCRRSNWEGTIGVNLIGMLNVCHSAVPLMRQVGKGRIVNMGSLAGKEGVRNLSVYSAASAGVIAFTKALGRELAETEIRVNCVAPGPIDTDMIRNLGPDVVNGMMAASPMKRLGTVDEVAELVLWLCSDACSFSTGAVFDISGGRGTY